MRPRMLVTAHGTRDPAGLATTRALVDAIAAQRPDVPVSLCFLDVAAPTLPEGLDEADGPAVVVPLLLSAGYHVRSDIPSAVRDRPGVRVARHLGPDPVLVDIVASRLRAAGLDDGGDDPGDVVLAAIASSRSSARAEVDTAASLLADRLDRPVGVLPLSGDAAAAVAALRAPIGVAVYLLAEGGFLAGLRSAVDGRGVVAEPIGVHPALVSLVWSRYDEVVASQPPPTR